MNFNYGELTSAIMKCIEAGVETKEILKLAESKKGVYGGNKELKKAFEEEQQDVELDYRKACEGNFKKYERRSYRQIDGFGEVEFKTTIRRGPVK